MAAATAFFETLAGAWLEPQRFLVIQEAHCCTSQKSGRRKSRATACLATSKREWLQPGRIVQPGGSCNSLCYAMLSLLWLGRRMARATAFFRHPGSAWLQPQRFSKHWQAHGSSHRHFSTSRKRMAAATAFSKTSAGAWLQPQRFSKRRQAHCLSHTHF